MLGLGFAWELGYTIAIPAVIFAIAGGYADRSFDSSPLFLLIGMALAFTISFVSIARKIKLIIRRMPKIQPKPPKKEAMDPDFKHEQQILHDLFRPPSP